MSRNARWSYTATLGAMTVAMTLAGGARAADGDDALKALIADCGGPNVERSDIDSCLERARDISEDTPSAQLQGLTARLERRMEALDDADAAQAEPARVAAQPSAPSGGGSSTVASADSAEKAAPH